LGRDPLALLARRKLRANAVALFVSLFSSNDSPCHRVLVPATGAKNERSECLERAIASSPLSETLSLFFASSGVDASTSVK